MDFNVLWVVILGSLVRFMTFWIGLEFSFGPLVTLGWVVLRSGCDDWCFVCLI